MHAPCILLGIFITQIDIECMELGSPPLFGGTRFISRSQAIIPLKPLPPGCRNWDPGTCDKHQNKT